MRRGIEAILRYSSAESSINIRFRLVDSCLNLTETGQWRANPIAFGDRRRRNNVVRVLPPSAPHLINFVSFVL